MAEESAPNSGGEASPDTPATDADICPACHGTGRLDGDACVICTGTGVVIERVA
jgi:DnaJ-class molecular chaperone